MDEFYDNILLKNNQKIFSSRKAVAPVIATLLLVAIAVVGGSIVFVFAQGYVNETQISAEIRPELLEVFGYDARDSSPLQAHNGLDILPVNCCGITDDKINPDERVAIHLQNHSSQPVTISELRFGGVVYQYTSTNLLGNWNGVGNGPQPAEYVIMRGNDGMPNGNILQKDIPELEAGDIVTLVLDIDRPIPLGRDVQVSITTAMGNVFVSTIVSGLNS